MKILCQDCDQGMADISDSSIDIIFTDPPYIKELYHGAYSLLAKHAPRILKPSGWLISYTPQYHLQEIMEILGGSLNYYWLIAQMNYHKAEAGIWHPNSSLQAVHYVNALCGFKPIVVYQKPPFKKPPKLFLDVVSGRKSKKHHPWEQSIHEALHILSRFSSEGDIILDPFMGSGTTILAANLLGLECIGFEIDPNTYEVAKQRLNQTPLDLARWQKVIG